jgi:hypothetical protein
MDVPNIIDMLQKMSTTFLFCNSLLGLNSFSRLLATYISRLLATCISSDALAVHWRIPFPDVQHITPVSKHHDANANQSLVYFFHWKLITFILRYEGPFLPVILSRGVEIVDLLKITNTRLCPTLCTVLRWTYIQYIQHSGTDSIIQLSVCLSIYWRIC